MQILKKFPQLFVLLAFCSVFLTSCEAIGSIFKAGLWSGIIVVVLVVALIIWLVGRARK